MFLLLPPFLSREKEPFNKQNPNPKGRRKSKNMSPLHPSIILIFTTLLADQTSTDATHVNALMRFSMGGYNADLTISITSFDSDNDKFNVNSDGRCRGLMARRRRFLSYDMEKRNRGHSNRRGVSYYNSYRRGCSYITRCTKDLH